MTDSFKPEKTQLSEQALTTKQALKYAEDLAQTYGELKKSENRYRALFEYAPVSLWEADLTQVKEYIDGLYDMGVVKFKEYFNEHPEEVTVCANLIRILDVNKATFKLYDVGTKQEAIGLIKEILSQKGKGGLKELLIALYEGCAFGFQDIHRTIKDKDIKVLIKAIIAPECEETWSRVLVSVNDLTESVRAEFLKKMFGRYLSKEVMDSLIKNPDTVRLGGEKRRVTIMISDLRGFTALSERLDPEQVVRLLNSYFEVMVDIVHKYDGTLNEIVGDSMLIIFGAPQRMIDRAQRAVACAIEMQNAMAKVNNNNKSQSLPEIEMGIGINDAEVVVGNIGSKKRSKYGVVGSGVNITSRIESYSVGGQILISESMYKKTNGVLRIDDQFEIQPKGSEIPLMLYEVGGIGGKYNLVLDRDVMCLVMLDRVLPVQYSTVDHSKYIGKSKQNGSILCLSPRSAEITLDTTIEHMTNLKLNLIDVREDLSKKDFFGKITKKPSPPKNTHTIRFTSVPPEISAYFQAICWYGTTVDK